MSTVPLGESDHDGPPTPQTRFVERGLASMEAFRRGAPTLSLEESMQGLRQRIEHARRCLTSASHPTQGASTD